MCSGGNLCEATYLAMGMDVRPGGQFMPLQKIDNTGITDDFDDQTLKTSNNGYFQYSLLLEDNNLPTPNTTKNWRHPETVGYPETCHGGYADESGTKPALFEQINGEPEVEIGANYFDEDGNEILNISTYTGRVFVQPHQFKYATYFADNFEVQWSNQLVQYHPDYECWDNACGTSNGDLAEMYEYENHLMAVTTGAEANQKGLYNPMNYALLSGDLHYSKLPSSVVTEISPGINETNVFNGPSVTEEKDPLQTVGWMNTTWENRFKEILAEHNEVATNNSIWQIVVLNTNEFTTTQEERDCWGDMSWALFRSLYIAARQQLIAEYIESISSCNAASNPDFTKRFVYKPSQITTQDNGFTKDYNNNASQQDMDEEVAVQCEAQCSSYVERWIKELSQCTDFANLLATQSNTDALMLRLINVCEGGCDGSNAFGAINVSPENYVNPAYPDKDFEQAIQNWLKDDVAPASSSLFVLGVCDDLLITWPMKYGHDYLAGAGPDVSNCACDDDKTPGVPAPPCPEGIGGTSKLPADDCACKMTNPNAKKILLSQQELEDNMLCQNCVSCQCMSDLVRSFVGKYDNYGPLYLNDEDRFKSMFENYFNRELGFNLYYIEYENYLRQCTEDETSTIVGLIATMEKRFMAYEPINTPQKESPIQREFNPYKPFYNTDKKEEVSTISWQYGGQVPYASTLMASTADFLTDPDGTYDAAEAAKIACGCEKILQAWYAFENQTSEHLGTPGETYANVLDAYNKVHGEAPCGGVDLDLAIIHCLELFGNGNYNEGEAKYHPTYRFGAANKSHIEGMIPNSSYASTITKLANDCPCDNGCLDYMDCCACKKLMEEKLLYDAMYPLGSTSFEAFLKSKHGIKSSPMPGYDKLLKQCKKFWEQGAGEDVNGNPIDFTTGSDPCASDVTKGNNATNAETYDLLIPKELSCDALPCENQGGGNPGPPGEYGRWINDYKKTDCGDMLVWLKEFTDDSNNDLDQVSNLSLKGGCLDINQKIVASYEKMRSEQVQSGTADPAVVNYFDAVYTHMQTKWMAAQVPFPADYLNLEQLIKKFKDCIGKCASPYTGPCQGSVDCDLCYEIDEAYLADFELYLNQVVNDINHPSYDPSINLFLFNNINSSFAIDPNLSNYPRIAYNNWLLDKPVTISPSRHITKYYGSSLLYPVNTLQAQLRYYLTYHDMTKGQNVKIEDGAHIQNYTLNYPSDARNNNLGDVVSFTNIKIEEPRACYYPTGYTIDAYQIVPRKYKNIEGVVPFIDLGQTLFYYQKTELWGHFDKMAVIPTDCFKPCASLCNRPFIPLRVVEEDPCKEILLENASYNAELRYKKYIKEYEANFRKNYKATCLNVLEEKATIQYSEYEYHHTLYYYDQAGSLIKTVPPAGVKYLNATEIENANKHRNGVSGYSRVTPDHEKITNYRYNTLKALITQHTPDGGQSTFWYDALGRLTYSQNAKQAATNHYSYTLYDNLSRPIEVGEIKNATAMDQATCTDGTASSSWVNNGTNRRQITRSFYETPLSTAISLKFTGSNTTGNQKNLRGRVSSTSFQKEYDQDPEEYDHASHYSYDIHGNVYEMIQDVPEMEHIGNRYKNIHYNYDLLSGNVHLVTYQKGKADQLIHKYTYDANNRLDYVETSQKGLHWEKEAKYLYYKHGSLARTEIGQLQVQGIDYAYTLQGWLKGVNSSSLNPDKDMQQDGKIGVPLAKNFGRDAFGLTLSYYDDGIFKDYNAIGASVDFEANKAGSDLYEAIKPASGGAEKSLYNGNIMHMATALPNANQYQNNHVFVSHTIGNVYSYDKLNRIIGMQSFDNLNYSSNAWQSGGSQNGDGNYHSTYTYDPDGNLQTLTRNGNLVGSYTGSAMTIPDMDNISYNYNTSTDPFYTGESINRLSHVTDVATGAYTKDIKGQNSNNYEYDAIGNLTKDIKEEIGSITWNVYGKIESIERSSGSVKEELAFGYDASGQRLYKIVKPRTGGVQSKQEEWLKTWYIRDASGNVMATYKETILVNSPNNFTNILTLQEQSIYGSSRVGILNSNIEVGTVDYTAYYAMNNIDFDPIPDQDYNPLYST